MDLTSIRGIGRAYSERLVEAGVRTVADLAWQDDLSTLSANTGIPAAKLAEFRAQAVRVAGQTHRSPVDVLHSVTSALLELGSELRDLSLQMTADALRWTREKIPAR